MVELPERPAPTANAVERARRWLRWVGPGRLLAGSVSVLAVLAAGYWLVKPPTATTESRLPFAPRSNGASRSTSTGAVFTSAVPAAPSTGGEVVVDVAGAVQHGGVYRLPSGSRVTDAVRAAGGLGATAASDAVNLAAVLVDGQRVYIPRVGETPPLDIPSASTVTPAGPITPKDPVNLNTATVDQLDRLPGVGPATAAAIIARRQQYGPFGSVDDLASVKGIGPAKIAALRGLVTV